MLLAGAAACLTACGDVDTTVPSRRDAATAPQPVSNLPAFFDCLDRERITLVSAHRGTDGDMPENALASIDAVVAATGGLVEVDVATSADGVLYLLHDDTLDRTTTGQGPSDASWSVIRTLSLRDDDGRVTAQRPTRLDELLVWAEGKVIPQLDIKQSTDYDDVAAVLRETGSEQRVVVIAYTLGQARLIARKMPRVMISATIADVEDLDDLERAGISTDRILAWTGNESPDARLYDALKARGVEVIFGTLGGRDSMDMRIAASGEESAYAELAGQGVEVLATDRPVEAARALKKGGRNVDAGVCLAG